MSNEIVAQGKPTGLVELPVEWILDDYAYYSYDVRANAYNRVGDNDVYEIYEGEFDRAYKEGRLFLLTMHPFVTGHRSRLAALGRLVAYMQSKPGVWFGTVSQVAMAAKAHLKRGDPWDGNTRWEWRSSSGRPQDSPGEGASRPVFQK